MKTNSLLIPAALFALTTFNYSANAQAPVTGQRDLIGQPVFMNSPDPVTVSFRETDEAETEGMSSDGVETDGMTSDGVETDGMSTDGITTEGITTEGESTDGIDTGGIDTDGIDSD